MRADDDVRAASEQLALAVVRYLDAIKFHGNLSSASGARILRSMRKHGVDIPGAPAADEEEDDDESHDVGVAPLAVLADVGPASRASLVPAKAAAAPTPQDSLLEFVEVPGDD
jgi:hypothetical protein